MGFIPSFSSKNHSFDHDFLTSSIEIQKFLRICLPQNFVQKNSFVLHKDWVVSNILRSFLCFMTLRFVHSEEGWLSKFSFNLNSSFDKNIFGAQKTISVLVIFSRKVGSEKQFNVMWEKKKIPFTFIRTCLRILTQ